MRGLSHLPQIQRNAEGATEGSGSAGRPSWPLIILRCFKNIVFFHSHCRLTHPSLQNIHTCYCELGRFEHPSPSELIKSGGYLIYDKMNNWHTGFSAWDRFQSSCHQIMLLSFPSHSIYIPQAKQNTAIRQVCPSILYSVLMALLLPPPAVPVKPRPISSASANSAPRQTP